MSEQRKHTGRTNPSAFEAALIELVDEARRDGISVAGAYDVRTPQPDVPDYTIEITEVTKRGYPATRS